MKEIQGVIFCHSCQTDLREKNKDFHIGMKHRVAMYKHDPRDKRYPMPKTPLETRSKIFGINA